MNTSTFHTKYGKFTLPQNDKYITYSFEQGNHWEERIINVLLKLVKKTDTIINVGSHVGTTLIPISKNVDRVFAFEPQENMFRLLLRNIIDNEAFNVIAFKGVVSNSHKKKVTIKSTDHSGSSINNNSSSKVNYGGVAIGLGGEEVFSYEIDNLELGEVNLITIDAEGSEELVLLSCIETVNEYRPILMIEQNHLTVTKEMEESLDISERLNIRDYLSSIGYYDPITLEGDNSLYIPKNFEHVLSGSVFRDDYGKRWTFREDKIVLIEDNSVNEVRYLSNNTIFAAFGNFFTIGKFNEELILWDNGTAWVLVNDILI